MDIKIKKRAKGILSFIANNFIVILFALFIVVPIYLIVITSLKTPLEANDTNFTMWPKQGFSFHAYERIFTEEAVNRNLIRGFLVTLVLYVPAILVGIFVSAMAAYSFAKMDFFLKKPIFNILLASLTLPTTTGMMAAVVLYGSIGWMGTALPLIVPRMMGGIGIIFFLRQYYMGLPDDLIGAAKVDGLSDYGIFLRIALPLSLPALGSQFILTFIAAYNDYLGPLYYLGEYEELYPVTLSLAFWNRGAADWALLMGCAVVSMIPMLCLYLLSQKFILKGVAITSGLKG